MTMLIINSHFIRKLANANVVIFVEFEFKKMKSAKIANVVISLRTLTIKKNLAINGTWNKLEHFRVLPG